jgi:23S rRNA (cytidine2498-2'-O)-methyltransferase
MVQTPPVILLLRKLTPGPLMHITPKIAYEAITDLEENLAQELVPYPYERFGNLFVLGEIPKEPIFWKKNTWLSPQWLEFTSIGDCQKKLRKLQKYWNPCLYQSYRRGALIQEGLAKLPNGLLKFGEPIPNLNPLGTWTLVEENLALISQTTQSPRPNGDWLFEEDKVGPPSRAYLKLWEVFSRLGVTPKKDELCLDLGASPGGWTWVLIHQLGARVIAYDRSPLAFNHDRLECIQGNAFTVKEEHLAKAQWLFSDVICYPEKLYEFLTKTLIPAKIPHIILTIKFQGKEDKSLILKQFSEIEGSEIIHLTANKHELTWVYGV